MSDIKHISLQFKCNESWEAMTPCDGGRHCQVCDKKVIDFSASSMEEFQASLQQEGGKLCGRFAAPQTVYANRSNVKFRSKWIAALWVLLGVSSCEDLEYEDNSINHHDIKEGGHHLMGSPIKPINQLQDTIKQKRNTSKIKISDPCEKIRLNDTVDFTSKSKPQQDTDMIVGMFSEPMPEYLNGGEEGMLKFISDNIKIKDSIGGRIVIRFMVDTSGKVQNAKIVRSLSPSSDSTVLSVVNQLEFTKINKPFYYNLPITIDIQE